MVYEMKRDSKMLTTKQREYARKIIKSHYRLKRQPTNKEIDLEIENLRRKTKLGACCDIAAQLRSRLSIGQHPIHFEV
ncbi:MAG: hypothetical protein QQN41_04080 [Nitrosopumilus sp.]